MPSVPAEAISTQTPCRGCNDDGIGWFYYIPLEEIPEWEACGWWVVRPLNEYAVLGNWPCKCEMKMPKGAR